MLFRSRIEEVSEASRLLISPEKPSYHSRYLSLSPLKVTSLYEQDLNDTGFLKEIQYLEYISPSREIHNENKHKNHFMESSPVVTSNITEEITHSSVSPGILREVLKSKNIVTLNFPRKTSITTIDESLHSICARSRTIFRMGLNDIPPQPQFNSVKISIGSFNSINSEFSRLSHSIKNTIGTIDINSKPQSKAKCCSCRKSKCLKLYCECFANGGFCQGCNCVDCHNTDNHKTEIFEAMEVIGQKNPFGLKRHFPEKIEETDTFRKCSKSGCEKKYCECFKLGKKCGTLCNCTGCKNNTALRTISYKKYEKIIRKRKISAI